MFFLNYIFYFYNIYKKECEKTNLAMSSKFLSGSVTAEGLTDGSADIYVKSVTVADLTSNKAIKSDGSGELKSTNLEISDVNNLQDQLTQSDVFRYESVGDFNYPLNPGSSLKIDIINEETPENGISIESNTLKDGGITLGSGATVNDISIDGTLSDNSDTKLATQKAVKTYVDNSIAVENLWDRSGTDLTPYTSGDNLKEIGNIEPLNDDSMVIGTTSKKIQDAIFVDENGTTFYTRGLARSQRALRQNSSLIPYTLSSSVSTSIWTVTVTDASGIGFLAFNVGGTVYAHSGPTLSVNATSLAGTDSVPKDVYIYVTYSGGLVLNASNTRPDGVIDNHVDIAYYKAGTVGVSSVTTYSKFEEATAQDELIHQIYNRFFDQGAIYISGMGITATSSDVTIASGKIKVILDQVDTTATQVTVNGLFYVQSGGTYATLTDFSFANYGDGGAIASNKYFNVILGIVNNNGSSRIMAIVQNEPSTEYTSASTAKSDVGNNTVYFPTDAVLKKLFVPVARIILQKTGTGVLQQIDGVNYYLDIRGQQFGSGSSSGGGISDHGNLTGLTDDDHTQYYNTTRLTDGSLTSLGVNMTNDTTSVIQSDGGNSKIAIEALRNSDATNATLNALKLSTKTTGTAGVGIGSSLSFELENSVGSQVSSGSISSDFTSVTPGDEQARFTIKLASDGSLFNGLVMTASSGDSLTSTFTGNLISGTIKLSSSTPVIDSIKDEDAMTSDSATALCTQQSIKAYVDTEISSNKIWTQFAGDVYLSSNPTDNLKIDSISEYTTSSGVTIDNVLLKDDNVSANSINTDTINEKTSGNGVTIDGVTMKDYKIEAIGDIYITTGTPDFYLRSNGTGNANINYYHSTSTLKAQFRFDINNILFVNSSGAALMYMSNTTPVYTNTATARAVYINSNGNIGTTSSLTAHKTNISDIGDTSWIYDLKPKIFNRKRKLPDESYDDTKCMPFTEYGLLAEDVVTDHEALADYNWNYDATSDTFTKSNLYGIKGNQVVFPLLKEFQRRNQALEILPDGTLKALPTYDNEVSTGIRDLVIDSSGNIGYQPSRKETKININYTRDYSWVYKLKPVTFNYRKKYKGKYTNNAEKETEYGLIAEDVEKLNKDMCIYNKDGKLIGVNYRKLVTPIIGLVKSLNDELNFVKGGNKKLGVELTNVKMLLNATISKLKIKGVIQ